MHSGLTIVFFEDHFTCTILPNESAWETLRLEGVEQVPLFFHVGYAEVRNDDFARERWEAGDPAAFGQFYRTIVDSSRTFRRFDLDLPTIELLHDVLARLKIAHAERMLAFGDRDESGDGIALRLCFIPDIGEDARRLIREYLATQGFRLQPDVDYLDALLCGLHRKGLIPPRATLALIDAAFGDVRFDYIEWSGTITTRARGLVPTRGVDRRVGVLARLMVEKAARQSTSTLLNDEHLLDEEVKRFHPVAARLLDQFEYDQLETRVDLSDFKSARIRVSRSEVEDRSSQALGLIKREFEKFIGLRSTLERITGILVSGRAIATPDFKRAFEEFGKGKLLGPFPNLEEIVSRGVFALSRVSAPEERVVEIKITLTTTSVAPPLPQSKRVTPPPAPQSDETIYGRILSSTAPPLPPRPGRVAEARPPVPPARPSVGAVRSAPPSQPPMPPPPPRPPGRSVTPPPPPPLPSGRKPPEKK